MKLAIAELVGIQITKQPSSPQVPETQYMVRELDW